MDTLRAPRGCPWDREQTHATLRQHLVEEAYEAIEAIDSGDADALTQELGDVLFQCVFHAQIAAEAGRFDLADAIDAIAAKLIRRHPHVFHADGRPLSAAAHRRTGIETPAAVKQQWEIIKAGERSQAGRPSASLLSGVPRSMPALLRAHEIGRRVAAVGFDWNTPADVVDKVDEEVRELRAALAEGHDRAAEELGDLLFSIASVARKLGLEPEAALRAANDKFTARFAAIEARLATRGESVRDAGIERLEALWADVKAGTEAGAPATEGAASARKAAAAAPPTSRRRPSSPARGRRRSRA
jgi:MazG family protein